MAKLNNKKWMEMIGIVDEEFMVTKQLGWMRIPGVKRFVVRVKESKLTETRVSTERF